MVRRGARQVEVPEMVSKDEAVELIDHCYNSVKWYTENGTYSEWELLNKMFQKGFPRSETVINLGNGESRRVVLAQHAVNRAKKFGHVLSDREFADRVVRDCLRSGKGISVIRRRLLERGVSQSVRDEVLADIDDWEALELAVETLSNTSRIYSESDPVKKRQKLVSSLLYRGFSYGKIDSLLNGSRAFTDEDEG